MCQNKTNNKKPKIKNPLFVYPRFEDFWKSIPYRGSVGVLTREQIKDWSKTVFAVARETLL